MVEFTAADIIPLIESRERVMVLDLRPGEDFCASHVPGSVPFPESQRTEVLKGLLTSSGLELLLVVSPGTPAPSLASIPDLEGCSVLGFLAFTGEDWMSAGGDIDMIVSVEADELAMDIPFDERLLVVDVRAPHAYAEGHAEGALNLPLSSLFDPGSMAMIAETDNLYIHGAGDEEGAVAAALLKRQGFHNLRIVEGGWKSIEGEAGIAKEKDPGKLN